MEKNDLILESDRLVLTPFSSTEATLFKELNNDPFIRRFMWDDEIIDHQAAYSIIIKNDQHFADDKYGIWKIQVKGQQEVIGYAGLWYFFDESQPQLIYAILEKNTKKGYATEASRSVIEYAFNRLGFEYLVAATDEPHKESQKVARRLGMSFSERRMENNKPTLFFRVENRRTNYASVEKIWNKYISEFPDTNKKNIPASFYFCDNEKDANECAELVVKGIKQATATSLWWYETNHEPIPEVGEKFIITDWDGNAKAIVEVTRIEPTPYNKISSEFARTEGEGDKSIEYWRRVHKAYYTREMEFYDQEFDESMTIICEYFKTIYTN